MGIKKNLHNHLAEQPTLDYDLHQGATQNLDPSYGPIEGIIVHNEEEPKKPGIWRKVGQFFKKVYSGIRNVADYVVSHRDNSNFSMPYASDQAVIKSPVSPDLDPIDFSQYIHTPQRPYPLVDQGTKDYFRQQFQNQIDLNELKANARKEVRAKALNIWNSRKQDDITKINLRPYQAFFDNLDRTNPTISYLHDRMQKDTLRKVYALDALHRMAKGDQRTEDDDKYFAENLQMLHALDTYKQKAEEEHQRQVNQAVEMAKARHQEKLFNDFLMPMIKQQNAGYGGGGGGPQKNEQQKAKRKVEVIPAEVMKIDNFEEVKPATRFKPKQKAMWKTGRASLPDGSYYGYVITDANADFSVRTFNTKEKFDQVIEEKKENKSVAIFNGTQYERVPGSNTQIYRPQSFIIDRAHLYNNQKDKLFYPQGGFISRNYHSGVNQNRYTFAISKDGKAVIRDESSNTADYKDDLFAIGGLVPLDIGKDNQEFKQNLTNKGFGGFVTSYRSNKSAIVVVKNKVILIHPDSHDIRTLRNSIVDVVTNNLGKEAIKDIKAAAFDAGQAKGVYIKTNNKDILKDNMLYITYDEVIPDAIPEQMGPLTIRHTEWDTPKPSLIKYGKTNNYVIVKP